MFGAFCLWVLSGIVLYIAFMETCRVSILTFDRRFETLASTVFYHWLKGVSQNDVERFNGETLRAAVQLLEGLNITYYVDKGMLLTIARFASQGSQARMIPWDEDADVVVTSSAHQAFRQARTDGKLAKLIDLTTFDLNLNLSATTGKSFAGFLTHRFSGRQVDFYVLGVVGKP